MFEQACKNIDGVLWKEGGCNAGLDYTEQSAWLLCLKYLDGLEQERATEARLDGKQYDYILDAPYPREAWAAPRNKDGSIDRNQANTGKDLVEFVALAEAVADPGEPEQIGEVFGGFQNYLYQPEPAS